MDSSKTVGLLATAGVALALAGCETIAEESTEALGFEYTAMLAPMAGGTGTGKVEISIDEVTNTLCSDLELSNGVGMTSGTLVGPGNAVIVTLDVPNDDRSDNDGDDSQECDDVTEAQVNAIKSNPSAYSVHINATTGNLHGTLRRE